MWATVADGINFLTSQSWSGLFALFWFTVVFDLPRYTFSFMAAAIVGPARRTSDYQNDKVGKVSVVLAGHNEASGIERCVRSLREQSLPPDEIIVVSDGSTDGMPDKLRNLRRGGIVDKIHCTDLRGGKSAALNLGERWASGEIIVVADCDSTFERHALKNILKPLADPTVGAVSGNILVRNPKQSLITGFQAIEYLISISLGKQAAALFDQVTCVSGAFGAFRRSAIADVNGIDVGGGEDLDLTLKLRKTGWRIVFAADAICQTDVPVTLAALVRQRFRWERDSVRLRYRKHLDLMNPLSNNFSIWEAFHSVEFLIFHVIASLMLPVYFIWLFMTFGDYALMVLLAIQIGLFLLDLLSFVLAIYLTPRVSGLSLLTYVPGFSLFNGFLMRNVRLAAYLQEWIFNASADDEYLPAKVSLNRRW